MRFPRFVAAIATAAALMLSATACAPSQGNTGGQAGQGQGQVANVYLPQSPTQFNPLAPFAGGEQLAMSLLYDNLVSIGPDFAFIPRLAESWDVNENATKYTFHLRPNLKWSDGQAFSSKDVLFTFNAIANPETQGGQGSRLSNVKGFDAMQKKSAKTLSGLTAPDANTVVFELSQPDAGFLGLIGSGAMFFILPEHVLGQVPAAQLMSNEFFKKPSTGMGPFTLENFQPDQSLQLKKNPNYYAPAKLDGVNLKILTSDVATGQLQSGEIDLVQIAAPDLDSVRAIPGVQVASTPSSGFTRLGINTTKAELKNPKVRQGLLTAIDRQGIVDSVLKGEGKVLNTSLMSDWVKPKLNDYAYDVTKAKQLLKEGGWKADQELKLRYVAGTRDRDQMVQVIVENWKAAGVKAVADPVDAATVTAGYGDKSYQAVIFGGGAYPQDPSTATPILTCANRYPAGGNVVFYCNPAFDAAMAAGGKTTDKSQRAAAYAKAAEIENADAPLLWINTPNILYAHREALSGFKPHGDWTYAFWNANEWTKS
ncbi:ABC transporter substrate-binding protein [Nigerium massiliense]|uniref:ABC transporter substrate-binding protein n=1 Tax=Nigerium massiliense TaxID=1522317 RepID=UPI00058DF7BD|nr:ABC transporter substrate-binding protein [Nigerium massiliense]